MCAYTGVRGRSTRAHGINVRAGVYACVRACANRYLLLLRNSFIIYSAAGDTPQDKPYCRGVYRPTCRGNGEPAGGGIVHVHPLRGAESNNITDTVPLKPANYKPVCRGNYKPVCDVD